MSKLETFVSKITSWYLKLKSDEAKADAEIARLENEVEVEYYEYKSDGKGGSSIGWWSHE